jgi:hypothetical protein
MGSIIRWERDEKLTVSLQLADRQELKKTLWWRLDSTGYENVLGYDGQVLGQRNEMVSPVP